MKNEYQKTSAKDLGLSFNFEILNHNDRILEIKLNGLLRDIKYNQSYFEWFMEDLIYLLDQNRYQKRWDYGVIKISNITSLQLNKEQENKFIADFKSVTNFDLLAL